jgi:hypothetical protein
LKGPHIRILQSCATELYEEKLQKVRDKLLRFAEPLCKNVEETPLPPLREINHEIPLIDLAK